MMYRKCTPTQNCRKMRNNKKATREGGFFVFKENVDNAMYKKPYEI